MSGDRLVSLRFHVKGMVVEAEVLAFTPDTVLLKIDPKCPFDADALRCLSALLEMLAKTLPFKRPNPNLT